VYCPATWRLLAAVTALAAGGKAEAQSFGGPRPSVLWAAPSMMNAGPAAGVPVVDVPAGGAMSRSRGLAIGAVIGGLVAGFLGHRMCQAYSAAGDCVGTALWWGAIGGMLGGLIGATAAGESEPASEDDGLSTRPERRPAAT
jgi:hypothetical protein